MSFLAMAGLFAAAWTRSRRGLHEVLSGTRTIGVRPSSRAVATTGPAANLSIALDSRAQQVGRFVLSGRLWDDGGEALDEGVDALNRRVWVHHVPPDRPLPSPARQQLASDVRLRWLDGQRSPSGSWDAYAAVDGQPLSPRDWAAVRAWLISLARELDRGIKDSTLALPLAIDRIWIATDGTVRMSDFPLVPPGGAETQLLDVTAAQRFLRQFAREALSHDAAGILPLAARRVLERLERQSYVTLNDVLVALEAVPSAVVIKSGVRAATVGLASILPGVMLTLAIVEVPKALAVRRSPDLDHLDRIITVYDRERRESGRFNFTADVLNRTRAQPRGLYSVGLGLNRWPAGGLGRFTDAQRRAFLTYLDSHVAAHGFALMRQLGPSYIVSRLLPRYSPSRLTASPAEQDSARQVAAPVLAHIEAVASQRRPFWLDHGLWIQVRVSAAYFVPALFGIVLAALFRGAVMLRLFGYDFVGPDGRRATYRRAVWRSVVAWSPALVWGAVLPPLAASSLSPLTVALIGVAVNLVMIGGAIWGIRHPNNSIQDRVARTKVVPA